jgi:hypothetical protein
MSEKLHYEAAPEWAGSPPCAEKPQYMFCWIPEEDVIPNGDLPSSFVLSKYQRDEVLTPGSTPGMILRSEGAAYLIVAYCCNN